MKNLQVSLGKSRSIATLRGALTANNISVSSWADDIFSKIQLSDREQTLDVVIASVEELGYPGGTTLENIYAAGLAKGYELCPAETAVSLLLEHPDEFARGYTVLAMEPVIDSDGDPELFGIGRLHGGLWLSASCGFPGFGWGSYSRFVFVLSK